ncbi:MAG TPA: response regulator transcription factor, partial [Acidimicrobiales bacterium]|nr:response regulator transcription factor [Acidimicrobiales bacterium]
MASILLVEDDASVREAVAMALEGEGHRVETAVSGDEALQRWRRSRPDLLLLDVMLPGADGLELLKEIKAYWPAVHVIMLTSYDNPSYVKQALAEGADGYMLKDSSPEDL